MVMIAMRCREHKSEGRVCEKEFAFFICYLKPTVSLV